MNDKEYLEHVYHALGNLMEVILEFDEGDYNNAANRSLNMLNILDEERLDQIDPSYFLKRDIKKCIILAVCLAGNDHKAESLYEDYMIRINQTVEDISE